MYLQNIFFLNDREAVIHPWLEHPLSSETGGTLDQTTGNCCPIIGQRKVTTSNFIG